MAGGFLMPRAGGASDRSRSRLQSTEKNKQWEEFTMMRLNRLVFTALWGLAIAAIVFATFGVNVRIGASRPTPTSQSRDPSTQPSTDDSIPASLENLLVTVTGLKVNNMETITLLPEP